ARTPAESFAPCSAPASEELTGVPTSKAVALRIGEDRSHPSSAGADGSAQGSPALDAAYEEYCRRQAAGERLDPDAFCAGFSGLRSSLRRLLVAHEFLEENPELLGDPVACRWPEPGDTFLGFEIRREIGRGAFARVFLATEVSLGHRPVALKVS